MKRILAIVLSIVMVFSLCACGDEPKVEKNCSSCGASISIVAAFCEYCGAAVNDTKTESNDAASDTSSSTESKTEEKGKPSSSTQTTNNSTETSDHSETTHRHSYSIKVTLATCTEKGYTTYICSCGDTYKDNYTDPSHSYTNYKCTKCGKFDKLLAYIGVEISQRYTSDQLISLGYPAGAVVVSVAEGGPAYESQIQRGDIITEFNGTAINDYTQLEIAIAHCKPGDSVTGKIFRAGSLHSFHIDIDANKVQ